MTDNEALERLKNTKDYLKEQYQDQVKKCPYPELKPIVKQTYGDNKKAFDIAIKAIEEFNRQKAEIERLKKENKLLSENADTAFQDGLNEAQDLYAKQIENEIKAETVKEFAERLKENIEHIPQMFFNYATIRNYIDNLLKEMVGEIDV